MQPDFDSRGVTRPLSAFLRLAMLGCPARRARGQLAAGACAPEPVWDRCGSSSAGACAWLRGCSAGAWGVCWRVCARLPLARLRGSAPRRRFRKVIGGTNRGIGKNGAPEPSELRFGSIRSRDLGHHNVDSGSGKHHTHLVTKTWLPDALLRGHPSPRARSRLPGALLWSLKFAET